MVFHPIHSKARSLIMPNCWYTEAHQSFRLYFFVPLWQFGRVFLFSLQLSLSGLHSITEWCMIKILWTALGQKMLLKRNSSCERTQYCQQCNGIILHVSVRNLAVDRECYKASCKSKYLIKEAKASSVSCCVKFNYWGSTAGNGSKAPCLNLTWPESHRNQYSVNYKQVVPPYRLQYPTMAYFLEDPLPPALFFLIGLLYIVGQTWGEAFGERVAGW